MDDLHMKRLIIFFLLLLNSQFSYSTGYLPAQTGGYCITAYGEDPALNSLPLCIAGLTSVYPGNASVSSVQCFPYPPYIAESFCYDNITLILSNAAGTVGATYQYYYTGTNYGCNVGDTLNTSTGLCSPNAIKNNGQPQELCAGNPINIGTGNKYQLETDYQGAGDFPLIFQRTYNSDPSAVSISFGANSGWRHSYERSISITSSSAVVVYREDGKAFNFNLVSSVWKPDADVNLQLSSSSSGWQLALEDGSIETYNSGGILQSIKSLSGATQTLNYTNGLLTTVTHTDGRILTLKYDTSNRLSTIQDPAGNQFTYAYNNTTGNLVLVTYPDQASRIYIYNEAVNTFNTNLPHALTGITDENGIRYATYQYNAQGQAITSQHAGGDGYVSVSYGANSSTVTDAFGTARTTGITDVQGVIKSSGSSQPAGAGCSASASNVTYDTNGNVASRTDFNGNLSCYLYDQTRNLELYRLEGLPATASCPITAAGFTGFTLTGNQRLISTIWNTSYRFPAQVTEPGRQTTYSYYASGNASGYPGALQTLTITDTNLNTSRSWNYTYDPKTGQVATVDGPRTDVSDVTTFAYYPATSTNNPPSYAVGDIYTITDAIGHVTTFTQYDGDGRPLSLTDSNGLIVNLAYDARGRLKQKTVAGNVTSFQYYPTGQLQTLTLPDNSNYTYTYDTAHRLTNITDNLNNQVNYTPDNMGNVTQQVINNPDGSIAQSQTALFDALNRLQQSVGANKQTSQFGYDPNGNLISSIDPKNHPTSIYTYDTLNRLTQIQDAAAGISQFTYNVLDQLTIVKSPNGAQTAYTIDAFGNRLKEVSPDRGTLSAAYDAAGNRISRTDARNVTASYSYDQLNRLKIVSYPASGENITYTYDTATGCTNGIGHLCQVQDADGSTAFAYDSQGNLLQQVRSEAGLSYATSYVYDSNNRVSQITSPGNRTVSYGRNAIGVINSISVPVNGFTTQLVDQISANALGLVTQQTFANGYTDSQGYNASGQTISEAENPATGGSQIVPLPDWALIMAACGFSIVIMRYGKQQGKYYTVLLILGFSLSLSGLLYSSVAYAPISLQYDPNGNISQRIDGSGTTTYLYDNLDRLANETGPLAVQSFNYDGNGNRTSDATGSYTYLSNSNQLNTAPGQTISLGRRRQHHQQRRL